MPNRLAYDFFARNTLTVARDLLGRLLVRELAGERLAGRIVEAEAYMGHDDAASHAHRGRTPRNAVMFGPPGITYVYFIYGAHWMLNIVAKPLDADYPAAVLIRALEPVEGLGTIARRRARRREREWASGPARLTMALAIDDALNHLDLTAPESLLYLETGRPIPDSQVQTGPRIGVAYASEPWRSMPWRFWVAGHPHVSR
jgi:DNA-3-methyladenine glycosylase